MTDQFPDATKMVPVPPPELVARWKDHWFDTKIKHINLEDYILAQAAQYGADQELEACCEWVRFANYIGFNGHEQLRAARRPLAPSLKKRVSKALDRVPGPGSDSAYLRQWSRAEAASLINDVRRALEALPSD